MFPAGFSLVFLMCSMASSYKILVYSPQFAHSHVTFMGQIADILALAGHNVSVYLVQIHENVTLTGVRHARTIVAPRTSPLPAEMQELQKSFWEEQGEHPLQILHLMSVTAKAIKQHCSEQMLNFELIERLKMERFDLGIAETYEPCGFGLFHLAEIKTTIAATASALLESLADSIGMPNIPSRFAFSSDRMSYGERVANLIAYGFGLYAYENRILSPVTELFRQTHGENFPELKDLISQASFVFINADEMLDFPRPITHKSVYIGGIGVRPPQLLSKEYERIFDESKDGVVLVSFGSVALSSTMPPKLKQAFLAAFSEFPRITFVWKYEIEDGIATGYDNVIVKKWVPQSDMLGHPKLLAFVYHAGMNSVQEAVTRGVPSICIPLFGDTLRNSKMVEKGELGVVLAKSNLSREYLVKSIRTILFNASYRENAQQLARMIARKPTNASQRVVKYAEFAAEFGPIAHLDSQGRYLNFLQYFLIDIIIPFFIAASTVLFLSIWLLLKLLVCCCGKRSKAKIE